MHVGQDNTAGCDILVNLAAYSDAVHLDQVAREGLIESWQAGSPRQAPGAIQRWADLVQPKRADIRSAPSLILYRWHWQRFVYLKGRQTKLAHPGGFA
jgi:hypothetical protein